MPKRHLMAYKCRIVDQHGAIGTDEVDWVLRRDNRVVVHQITVVETVETPNGPMLLVKLKQQAEYADPNVDIAVLVGQAKTHRKNGKVDGQSPELWYYGDKFWLKARSGDHTEYYHKQQYLFYEVRVQNEAQLLAATSTGLEPS